MIETQWLNGKKTDPRAKPAINRMMELLSLSDERDEAVKMLFQVKIETYCYNTCLAWRKSGRLSSDTDNPEYHHEPQILVKIKSLLEEYVNTHSTEDIEKTLVDMKAQIDIYRTRIHGNS
ncbi:hypothetical protein TWF694_008350 [Orbilia ellipsospora]